MMELKEEKQTNGMIKCKPRQLTANGGNHKSSFELIRAIRELKQTAPGLSGVPAVMWKAMSEDATLKSVMLDIMRGNAGAQKRYLGNGSDIT